MGVERQSELDVQHGELSYWAALEPPVFDLPAAWVTLQSDLYARLARFGLGLSDIKVETTSPNPGDFSLAAWLFNLGLVARYRCDRVEVWSNKQRLANDPALASEIVEQAMSVLRAASPSAMVKQHTVILAVHGLLAGVTQASRVAAYVTRVPDGIPSLVPSGVSFACEGPEGFGQGSIVLERSGMVNQGAFLRIALDLPGILSEKDALARANEFLGASLERMDLKMLWRD